FSKIFMLLLLLMSFSTAFGQKYYDEQWKKIEVNSRKGTYKSNLPIVLDIQNQAMKENNALQLIRSLKAEFSIVNRTSDDDQNDAVSKFFVKLQSAENKLKGQDQLVYKILLNSFFMDYYDETAWEIGNRINMDSQDLSQIETWSRLDFKNYISKNFKELDQQKQEMKKIPLEKYKDIFSETKNIGFFPTLLDWYSFKKISFLSDSNLFTKNEQAENRTEINAVFDELIAQNSGNSKLYFMHQKLQQNCHFNRCKDM